MSRTSPPLTSRAWFGKGSAGLLLGLGATLALIGVLGRLFHIQPTPQTIGAQFLMWLLPPCWVALLSVCFLFRSPARAWGVLGALTLVLWCLFLMTRSLVA